MNSRKIASTSRRTLLTWGCFGLGSMAIAALPKLVNAQSNSSPGKTLAPVRPNAPRALW